MLARKCRLLAHNNRETEHRISGFTIALRLRLMAEAEPSAGQPGGIARWVDAASGVLQAAGPALLFGLRLWASVCLALYVAFWLELSNPFWAGLTAAIVCQPQLGASLRKGWFRLIGTVVGAAAAVVLTAIFPQSRAGFILGLALWAAVCGFFATVLRNFATYAAALAGFTAAIIASDELGAVGGANGQAFILAVDRASEICIGIVCAGIVLAGTDFGTARRRLAAQFAALAAEITGRLARTLRVAGPQQVPTREIRRGLIGRVIALDPVIDQALGKSSTLRYHSRILQEAFDGLFAALAAWRTAAYHLEQLSAEEGRADAEIILRRLPSELRSAPVDGTAPGWVAAPCRLGIICDAAVGTLIELPVSTPSLRLIADRTAGALAGISLALNGLALLVSDPARAKTRHPTAQLRVPDWLPAFVNAGRTFVTIGAVALFWIVTAWPGGASAITFAAVGVLLFGTRGDQAYAAATSFILGVLLTTAAAAVVDFAVLPDVTTFPGFCFVIGLYLVPVAALMAVPWRIGLLTGLFTAMASLFIAVLTPQNPNIYDTQQFYNSSLAINVGLGAAMIAFRLLPPLSPAYRTRRLLALTLRDLRRLAARPVSSPRSDWAEGLYGRLSVLPAGASLEDRARLVAALAIGNEIIRLRNFAGPAGFDAGLDAALAAVAEGHSALAIRCLGRLDRRLAEQPDAPEPKMIRARAVILAMSEALTEYSSYFDAKELR